jgi:PhnB protein
MQVSVMLAVSDTPAAVDGSGGEIQDHRVPWGVHRQCGFTGPFGHAWLAGDQSPLQPFPA